ncbi:ImmA/IrrE family metallo-endopeptidase [Tyzzerella sp. OttesenSCG-928-J15]|nr:ImmA/IrrE family metallo-endopeptidase [Tyzzerella sp. OttesenSCG-928-J15]
MNPDYTKAFDEAFNVLLNYSTHTLPVDLGEIIGKIKTVQLCTFSKLCRLKNITIDEATYFFASELGAIVRDGIHYIIYYNDTINNENLNRFTIAHELGHFFLEHLDFDGISLKRGVDEERFDIVEKEANCFARNLLSPTLLLDSFRIRSLAPEKQIDAVSKYFAISGEAAKTRLDLYEFDRNELNEDYIDNWPKFTYADWRQCKKCGHTTISGEFCEICGNSLTDKANYIHPNTLLNKNIKIYAGVKKLRCPSCGRLNHTAGTYSSCTHCGHPLENTCLNEKQAHSAPVYLDNPAARYCPVCGSPTSYFAKGLLKPYSDDEPYFMDWLDFCAGRQSYLRESSPDNRLKPVSTSFVEGYKWLP